MLFTICHRKFQFGHQSSWNMHFSDETMGENARDGERRTEKSQRPETLSMLLLKSQCPQGQCPCSRWSAMVTTAVTEKTHAWGLQNVTLINTDLELPVS